LEEEEEKLNNITDLPLTLMLQSSPVLGRRRRR
jgi:hypothetical protein